ncbi:MAG: hypothetical protein M3133_03820 [Actinomycetota bacterium]|nr:hypothetical protein [Actinomycetota bacterium]
MARREDGTDEEEQGGGGLRLAFVVGYDEDADWLDCLAYIWRPETRDAVWALERWEQARSLLRLYTGDPSFDSQRLDASIGGCASAVTTRWPRRSARVLGGG